MKMHLFYFMPGEEARMLARCQFGLSEDGNGGALITYPIKGCPWRRNVMRSFSFPFTKEQAELIRSLRALKIKSMLHI